MKKNCETGFKCGGSCISKTKNCRPKVSAKAGEKLDNIQKLRFTFGRMRIATTGHIKLADYVDVIGVSEKSRPLKSAENISKLTGKEARYAQTIGALIDSFPPEAQLELVLGMDQEKFGRGLEKAFAGRLTLTLLERPEGAPSSTAARKAMDDGLDLVELRLARDSNHVEIMKEQYRIEKELLNS